MLLVNARMPGGTILPAHDQGQESLKDSLLHLFVRRSLFDQLTDLFPPTFDELTIPSKGRRSHHRRSPLHVAPSPPITPRLMSYTLTGHVLELIVEPRRARCTTTPAPERPTSSLRSACKRLYRRVSCAIGRRHTNARTCARIEKKRHGQRATDYCPTQPLERGD